MKIVRVAILAAVVAGAAPAAAQNVEAMLGYSNLMLQKPPVTDVDITDRPYRVIGRIETTVRKATVFSKAPPREKVFKELWERGSKMGADAVIQARYVRQDFDAAANPMFEGTSYGQRASGLAVKFLTDAEIAALPKPQPKP